MVKKKNPADRHLNLRRNTYWYTRRIPKELQSVLNISRIDVSLKTSDLKYARALRDLKDAEISRLTYDKNALRRCKLEEAIKHFKQLEESVRVQNDEIRLINTPLTPRCLDEMGLEIEADALRIVEGNQAVRDKYYSITLAEALSLTLDRKRDSISDESKQKYDKAAEKFAAFLCTDTTSTPLNTIDRVLVHKFVLHLETTGHKRSTIQGLLSRLKVIWQQASNLGHVPAANPFENQEIVVADSREDNKTQLFDDEELKDIIKLVNQESNDFKLIIKILAFTGARPKEICSLTVSAFQEHSGVKVLVIKQGKTLAASRFIPLTEELITDIEKHCLTSQPDAPMFYLDEKEVGRLFSRIKKKVVKGEARKVMYSLRVHFATAAQRAGIREDIAAQLVGHSNAKTLTFGYYSKGYEPPILKRNYDQIADYIRQRWQVHITI